MQNISPSTLLEMHQIHFCFLCSFIFHLWANSKPFLSLEYAFTFASIFHLRVFTTQFNENFWCHPFVSLIPHCLMMHEKVIDFFLQVLLLYFCRSNFLQSNLKFKNRYFSNLTQANCISCFEVLIFLMCQAIRL